MEDTTDSLSIEDTKRKSTGVPDLDQIVNGGFLTGHNYLVRGEPGTGKSTLGLQFLAEGVAQGESSLYINLGEKERTIQIAAEAFDIPFDEIAFLDKSPSGEEFLEDDEYDLFSAAEVERDPLFEEIGEAVETHDPERVLLDPVTQLRYLTADTFEFRKQLMSMLRHLTDQGATVLFTSQSTPTEPDDDLQFLSDGIVTLTRDGNRRRILVEKFRGSDFEGGKHSMDITDQGVVVYPTPDTDGSMVTEAETPERLTSGIPEFDKLLGGGIERGTTTMITGPSGVGKSTLASVLMHAGAGRGEASSIYMFEESPQTLLSRTDAINIPLESMIDNGQLHVDRLTTTSLDPAIFTSRVKTDIEEQDTDLVVLDGIEGYKQALNQDEVIEPLHELVQYLTEQDVTVVLIGEIKAVTGEFRVSEYGGTYLADNLIFMQHVELDGKLRKTIGVLKKRLSNYERTLREFQITEHGIRVGDPMEDLQGVLTGTPEMADDGTVELLSDE
ncbi:MAG: ATPase domain-containing protein [archaeon]